MLILLNVIVGSFLSVILSALLSKINFKLIHQLEHKFHAPTYRNNNQFPNGYFQKWWWYVTINVLYLSFLTGP